MPFPGEDAGMMVYDGRPHPHGGGGTVCVATVLRPQHVEVGDTRIHGCKDTSFQLYIPYIPPIGINNTSTGGI
jgi:hypothetical protein